MHVGVLHVLARSKSGQYLSSASQARYDRSTSRPRYSHICASWTCCALPPPNTWYHEGPPLCWSPVSSPGLPKVGDASIKSSIDPVVRFLPPTVCDASFPWQDDTMVRRSWRGCSEPPCLCRAGQGAIWEWRKDARRGNA
jgi:hypothetical protein